MCFLEIMMVKKRVKDDFSLKTMDWRKCKDEHFFLQTEPSQSDKSFQATEIFPDYSRLPI